MARKRSNTGLAPDTLPDIPSEGERAKRLLDAIAPRNGADTWPGKGVVISWTRSPQTGGTRFFYIDSNGKRVRDLRPDEHLMIRGHVTYLLDEGLSDKEVVRTLTEIVKMHRALKAEFPIEEELLAAVRQMRRLLEDSAP